jgi:CheY-like chemotaxis protein
LDLDIKDMSGFDLLDKLKSDEDYANIPIIVNTGRKISKEEEIKLKKYGAAISVKNPVSNKRLLEETLLFLHKIKENPSQPFIFDDLKDVLSGKTVLLTDDDMRNVFSLTAALEQYGLKIIAAWDGKEAIRKLSEEKGIDIVLMDIMMPEMDGYEAMREIRKDPKYKNLPIIALTAKAMKEDRAKCLEAGASDYISKPVNVMQLLSLMRTWLYNK